MTVSSERSKKLEQRERAGLLFFFPLNESIVSDSECETCKLLKHKYSEPYKATVTLQMVSVEVPVMHYVIIYCQGVCKVMIEQHIVKQMMTRCL